MSNLTTRSAPPRFAPLLESSVLVGLGAIINIALYPSDPGFVSMSPHPTLFITLLILIRYGMSAGLQAAAVSTVAYATLLATLADVPTFLHLLTAPYSTPIVVLVPATVLLGMLVQRHLDRLAASEAMREALARDNALMQGEQAKLRDVNVQLAGKVVGAEGTVATLYRYAKELSVKEVDGIFRGIARMLEEVIQAEAISIWRVTDGSELSLALHSPDDGKTAAPPNIQVMGPHFDRHGVLSIHDFDQSARTAALPYLAGKLCDGRGGVVVAYLLIDKLPFARYNAETIRLFTMVVDWASDSLANAIHQSSMIAQLEGDDLDGDDSVDETRERFPLRAEPARSASGSFEEDTVADIDGSFGFPLAAEPIAGRSDAAAAPSGDLSNLLADAENALERSLGKADAPAATQNLASATAGDAPLQNLLAEIGSYLTTSSKKVDP